MYDHQEEELEWNMAQYRLRTIGRITETVRLRYVDAARKPSTDNIKEYFTALKALFREVKLYMDDRAEAWIYRKTRRIDNMLDADVQRSVMQELEELDDKLNEERLDAGLDIPSKTKPDPSNAAVDGLTAT